jgi:hypothetical protein
LIEEKTQGNIIKICFSYLGGSITTSTAHSRTHRKSAPDHLPEVDLYHERKRLFGSSPNTTDHISLTNGKKASNGKPPPSSRKFSVTYTESIQSGNEYTTRLTHPRESTITIANGLSPNSSSNSAHNRQGISQRTTKMLVICSTTFLLFNSPYCMVLLYSMISNTMFIRTLGILRHFYFMSFCLNFFLYSLCGNRFRHELILLFKTCCQKCCTKNMRSHWSRIDKIPQQSSFTRVSTRVGGV